MHFLRSGTFVVLATIVTWSTAMAHPFFPYSFTSHALPNGLRVIMIPMESPGLVAYYSVVRTGSRDEVEQEKSGFAHFFEHMMFRGTKNYPAEVYDRIVTSIGAHVNAYTTDDYTAYHANFAVEDLEQVIQLESDRFQNLSYEKPAFQTEAGAVYGEYRKGITNPFEVLNEKMQDLAYDAHTYKHTTIGFEADIKAMPEQYEYSLSFFRRFYRPDNVVLVIAGDIATAKTLSLVVKYYSGWQKGYQPPAIRPEPPQQAERTAEISYEGKTLPILDIAYKGEAFDPDNRSFVAALLFGDIAFGETSEIFKTLYVKDQKVEALQASIPMNRDMPLFEITSMIKDVKDIALVRDAVYATIRQFSSQPVDRKRLDDLKRRWKYSFLMRLDTPDHVAGGCARMVALSGGIEAFERLHRTMDAITPEDIQAAVQKYFVPERRSVVVLKGTHS